MWFLWLKRQVACCYEAQAFLAFPIDIIMVDLFWDSISRGHVNVCILVLAMKTESKPAARYQPY